MELARALDHLLGESPHPAAIDSVPAWWARHQAATAAFTAPIARALVGGFLADRPGYAFASGLNEALCQLLRAAPDRRRALCATEEGGAHPRAIAATLTPDGDGYRLDGAKRWTSLGTYAQELLVVARTPAPDGDRPRLVVARVPADREGVALEPMPPTPFVPEIPHARVRFTSVRVAADERLPGDGYDRYLKPFRTLEDCFVHASLLSWWLQVGRRAGWPNEQVEALALTIAAAAALADADPTRPGVHRALGGLIARARHVLHESDDLWDRIDPETRARWLRDRPLLGVASAARGRRLEVARERLS
ncbi:MAG: acyl-CoA dehydrogenase family protein [Nannocystaceae bacterium]